MDHRVLGNITLEFFELISAGQLTLQQQVGNFEEITFACQLFNRVTAVT